jgi:hypothetical protein
MTLRVDSPAAQRLASRMTGRPESEMAPEEARATLGELAAMIASRVQAQVAAGGEHVSVSAPSLGPRPSPPDGGEPPVALGFVSTAEDLRFAIVLTPARATDDRAAGIDGPALAAIA